MVYGIRLTIIAGGYALDVRENIDINRLHQQLNSDHAGDELRE